MSRTVQEKMLLATLMLSPQYFDLSCDERLALFKRLCARRKKREKEQCCTLMVSQNAEEE